jgi:hypothetical protein
MKFDLLIISLLYEYNYYMILNLIFITQTPMVEKAQYVFLELVCLYYVLPLEILVSKSIEKYLNGFLLIVMLKRKMKQKEET